MRSAQNSDPPRGQPRKAQRTRHRCKHANLTPQQLGEGVAAHLADFLEALGQPLLQGVSNPLLQLRVLAQDTAVRFRTSTRTLRKARPSRTVWPRITVSIRVGSIHTAVRSRKKQNTKAETD